MNECFIEKFLCQVSVIQIKYKTINNVPHKIRLRKNTKKIDHKIQFFKTD